MMTGSMRYWIFLKNSKVIMAIVLWTGLLYLSPVNVAAQTYPIDSSDHFLIRSQKKIVNYYLGEGSPNPKTSVLFSMIVPGAGQVYNRQAWKLPFIYGGYGALINNLAANQDLYRRFDVAYRRSVEGLEHEFERLNLSSNALRSYRDQYLRNVELTYIGMGAVYVITLLDAFVSAHLSTFDVSDDLSLHIPAGSPAAPMQLGISYRF